MKYTMYNNDHQRPLRKGHFRSRSRWMICMVLDCVGPVSLDIWRVERNMFI